MAADPFPAVVLQNVPDQLDGLLEEWGGDPDPAAAIKAVERLQTQLATLRQSITDPRTPLSSGERVAASHHVQVIAGSLGVLHKAFRQIVSDEGKYHASP